MRMAGISRVVVGPGVLAVVGRPSVDHHFNSIRNFPEGGAGTCQVRLQERVAASKSVCQ